MRNQVFMHRGKNRTLVHFIDKTRDWEIAATKQKPSNPNTVP